MATSPSQHPLDREIERIYAAHPGLKEELDEMERQLDAGDLELLDDDPIRRRAQQLAQRLGEPLAEDES